MPVKRSSFQSGETLLESYKELSKHESPYWASFGSAMFALVKAADRMFKSTEIWGFLSHEELKLQAENRPEAPWYVRIYPSGAQYELHYKMPINKAPWKHAVVSGAAHSLEEAKYYLLVARKECEGWKGNSELSELLSRY